MDSSSTINKDTLKTELRELLKSFPLRNKKIDFLKNMEYIEPFSHNLEIIESYIKEIENEQ